MSAAQAVETWLAPGRENERARRRVREREEAGIKKGSQKCKGRHLEWGTAMFFVVVHD